MLFHNFFVTNPLLLVVKNSEYDLVERSSKRCSAIRSRDYNTQDGLLCGVPHERSIFLELYALKIDLLLMANKLQGFITRSNARGADFLHITTRGWLP
jgi:hypothetical protein